MSEDNYTEVLLKQIAHRKDELYGAVCRIAEAKTLEEALKIANDAILGRQ